MRLQLILPSQHLSTDVDVLDWPADWQTRWKNNDTDKTESIMTSLDLIEADDIADLKSLQSQQVNIHATLVSLWNSLNSQEKDQRSSSKG